MFRSRRFIQPAIYGKASGAAFTPASLSNIILWGPASQARQTPGGAIVTTTGQSVQQLTDMSGAGNNLPNFTGGAPSIDMTAFNGHPCVIFDSAGNKSLYSNANSVALPGPTNKMSCFMAVNFDSANHAVEHFMAAYLGNTQTSAWNNTASAVMIEDSDQVASTDAWGTRANATYVNKIAASPAFTNNVLIGSVYDGSAATWKFYVGNGTTGFAQVDSQAFSAVTFTSPGQIGLMGYNGLETGWQGKVAEIVMTNDAMGTTDIANLWTYWHTTYGVG